MRMTEKTDVEECRDRIERELKEYNCNITYDDELRKIIVVDSDTHLFEELTIAKSVVNK